MWMVVIGIVLVILIIGIALMNSSILQGDSNDEISSQLIDFCFAQLVPEVDNCIGWRDDFIDLYNGQIDHCMVFDADSPLLLMCLDNVVMGRGGG
jgi:hypothetical protein